MQEREWLAEHVAFLSISSQNPDLLKGIERDRIMAFQKHLAKHLPTIINGYKQISLAGLSLSLHLKLGQRKVFPHLPEEQQMDALWEAIFAYHTYRR